MAELTDDQRRSFAQDIADTALACLEYGDVYEDEWVAEAIEAAGADEETEWRAIHNLITQHATVRIN